MKHTLEIENLCKTYKKSTFTLDHVTMYIPQGAIMGFVGKNGAGKTTTINTILNITYKDSGTVKLFGANLDDKNVAIRNDIGVVFDNTHFSIENTPIKIEKVMNDIYKNWNRKEFFRLLEQFGLPKDKKIKTFSRGMMMKLSTAVALSHHAKLLILDEATAGLDPVAREELLDILLEFMENETHSILMSSHISSDLEKIADYITFIDNGKIILTENKDTLLYEYGIARIKQADFEQLEKEEYIAARTRGLQIEVLMKNKKEFIQRHPDFIVDNICIDEMLALLTKEDL